MDLVRSFFKVYVNHWSVVVVKPKVIATYGLFETVLREVGIASFDAIVLVIFQR